MKAGGLQTPAADWSCSSDDIAGRRKGLTKASKTNRNSEPLHSTESRELFSCAFCSGSVPMKRASRLPCGVLQGRISWGRCAWSTSPGRFSGQGHLSTSFPGWQCSLLGCGAGGGSLRPTCDLLGRTRQPGGHLPNSTNTSDCPTVQAGTQPDSAPIRCPWRGEGG